MDIQAYIQRQIAATHWGWDPMLQELTEEQFNWTPPGTGNTIAATVLHAFGVEDHFIQSKLLDQPLVWEAEGWAEKIGVEAIPDLGNGWVGMKGKALAKAPVIAYGKAVHAATDRYLARLTPQELDKKIIMGNREGSAAELLSILVVHTSSHTGEIAVLKGLQGLQGQPI